MVLYRLSTATHCQIVIDYVLCNVFVNTAYIDVVWGQLLGDSASLSTRPLEGWKEAKVSAAVAVADFK